MQKLADISMLEGLQAAQNAKMGLSPMSVFNKRLENAPCHTINRKPQNTMASFNLSIENVIIKPQRYLDTTEKDCSRKQKVY